MNKIFIVFLLFGVNTAYASTEIDVAIDNVRQHCSNISSELNDMKTMAGINTAVTGVGTVAGGVGLATGLAKTGADNEIEKLEKELETLKQSLADVQVEHIEIDNKNTFSIQLDNQVMSDASSIQQLEQELSAAEQKSKNLGNWRTGMLATATVTNVAGTVIAVNNRVKGDLKSQIDSCLDAVDNLQNVRMQAYVSDSAEQDELSRADKIIYACSAWRTVDVSSINNRSTGAAASGGLGAGLGLAGTIVSAMSNSDATRHGDSQKEKNMNNAANVLAGGTTVASGAAVIFNATQIGAIKRAASVADECEGALK